MNGTSATRGRETSTPVSGSVTDPAYSTMVQASAAMPAMACLMVGVSRTVTYTSAP